MGYTPTVEIGEIIENLFAIIKRKSLISAKVLFQFKKLTKLLKKAENTEILGLNLAFHPAAEGDPAYHVINATIPAIATTKYYFTTENAEAAEGV